MIFEFKKLMFSIEDKKIRLNGLPFVEVHIAGEKKDSHYGLKMISSSEGERLEYVSHIVDRNTLIITQKI